MAPNPRANLAAMPQEVFNGILDQLRRSCGLSFEQPFRPLLGILRLVSKAINSKVLAEFAGHYFYTVDILASGQKSLQNGLTIASNPIFGAAVRNLRFYLDELSDVQDVSSQDRESSSEYEEAVAAWKSTREAQLEMRRSGQDLKTLVLMMCHLRRHGNIEMVVFFDKLESGTCSEKTVPEYRALKSKHDSPDLQLETPEADNITQIATVMRALSLSGLAPNKLCMSPSHWCLPAHIFGLDKELLSYCRDVLAQVTYLRLAVWVKSSTDDIKAAKDFFDMIAAAPELKTLELEIMTAKPYVFALDFARRRSLKDLDADASAIATLLLRCTIPSLRELKIQGSNLVFKDLQDFVHRHSALTKVALHFVRFEGGPELQSQEPRVIRGWVDNQRELEDAQRAVFEQRLEEALGVDVEYWYEEDYEDMYELSDRDDDDGSSSNDDDDGSNEDESVDDEVENNQ